MVKVLIGASPGALITFVSDCFGGHTSEKAFVDDSDILINWSLFKDIATVDKGFNIDSARVSFGIGVVLPPFQRK